MIPRWLSPNPPRNGGNRSLPAGGSTLGVDRLSAAGDPCGQSPERA